jgi:hypothetical protein
MSSPINQVDVNESVNENQYKIVEVWHWQWDCRTVAMGLVVE